MFFIQKAVKFFSCISKLLHIFAHKTPLDIEPFLFLLCALLINIGFFGCEAIWNWFIFYCYFIVSNEFGLEKMK